ncbi:hypothetical protein KGF57_004173 [Candida theae]|uniref:Uncharacterized protein n=1 Tax=Candida theae TaxID=1198502 RepID=A0AAD5FX66_9ASCO|nr:uncharacterized protein KGF57_004173 [Candida theae]KAI5952146.1 hypothetical protein KGF57_004173 [Candida theae]
MTTDSPDEGILKFVLFQSKHVKLYNLPRNLLSQLKTGSGIDEQVECLWTGSVNLVREIKQDNLQRIKHDDPHTIPAFTHHRLKLEFVGSNSNDDNLWGETWYAPINKNLRAELGLEPNKEDIDTEVETSHVKMEQIIAIANDGTDTIRELSYELGIVSTQWFRVIVQLPHSGYHPKISDAPDGSFEEKSDDGDDDDEKNVVQQVALLLRFKHDFESDEFLEQLENYNMRYDHLQRQYYYDKWAEILDQDTVSNGDDADDDADDKSKESELDTGAEDLSLADNENNYEAKDGQEHAEVSSDSEDDDFGDFVSK